MGIAALRPKPRTTRPAMDAAFVSRRIGRGRYVGDVRRPYLVLGRSPGRASPLIRTRDDLLELIAHVLRLQLGYLSNDQALAVADTILRTFKAGGYRSGGADSSGQKWSYGKTSLGVAGHYSPASGDRTIAIPSYFKERTFNNFFHQHFGV